MYSIDASSIGLLVMMVGVVRIQGMVKKPWADGDGEEDEQMREGGARIDNIKKRKDGIEDELTETPFTQGLSLTR